MWRVVQVSQTTFHDCRHEPNETTNDEIIATESERATFLLW